MDRIKDVRPLCEKGKCPVQDLATDVILNEWLDKFLLAKHLFLATEDPRTQHKIFEDLGLYDDPILHLELEFIFAEYRHKKRNQGKGGTQWVDCS